MASPSPEIKAQLLREEALEALAKAHVSFLVAYLFSQSLEMTYNDCGYRTA